MPLAVLLAALAEVPDPRRAQGQRYSIRHLLLFSVLAVLAGATSYQKIIAFIALQRERLNTVFGACFRRAPAVNTLRHLFLTLGPDDLEAAFRRHARDLNAHSTPEAPRTVALDGKTLRGSFDHLTDRKAVHVLSAFASDAVALLRRRALCTNWKKPRQRGHTGGAILHTTRGSGTRQQRIEPNDEKSSGPVLRRRCESLARHPQLDRCPFAQLAAQP